MKLRTVRSSNKKYRSLLIRFWFGIRFRGGSETGSGVGCGRGSRVGYGSGVGGGSEKCLEKASSINSDKKFSTSLSSVSNISAFKF